MSILHIIFYLVALIGTYTLLPSPPELMEQPEKFTRKGNSNAYSLPENG